MSTKLPTVRLGEVLTRIKDEISVEDKQTYARLTIRMNGNGIVLRDRVPGHVIGTKKQFLARAGQLVLSKIDARNGAFGILSSEFDNAIITGNFWAFDVDKKRLLPAYFDYLTKTRLFVEFCVRASEGTTNRLYLQEDQFLAQQIMLPPLTEQTRIVARVEELEAKIREAQAVRQEIESGLNALLNSTYQQIIRGASKKPLGEIAPLNRRPVVVEVDKTYPQVAVRSFGRGTFHKPDLNGSEVTWQKPFLVKAGDILVSNIKAWEGAIAVAGAEEDGRVGSHRYLTCAPVQGVVTARFVCFHLLTPEGLYEVGEASPGSADRNRTLNVKRFSKIPIPVPDYRKQLWFEALYGEVDRMKRLHAETVNEIDALMPSILGKAFRGEL
jgi:type I restriction enzyme S subunit